MKGRASHNTHAMRPLTFGSLSDAVADSAPLGLDTSKTARTEAARMKSVASTKCLPGQTRLPAPNASGISDGSLTRRRRLDRPPTMIGVVPSWPSSSPSPAPSGPFSVAVAVA